MNKVSLRAFHDHIDVSEIAKKFGGGGHPKAAGFQLPGDASVDEIFDVEIEKAQEKPKKRGRPRKKQEKDPE